MLKRSTLDASRNMPHVEASVEQRKSGVVGSRQRGDQIVEIRTSGVRAREPVADLVFGVDAWEHDDAIDVPPFISELGLERKLLAHGNETHDLVRRVLLDKRQ